MIFLTVGTQFPFDRLVKAVDDAYSEGLISDEVFAQVGHGSYVPVNFKYVESLDKRSFDKYMKECSAVISHSGMGTITMAMELNKPLFVMPRSPKYGEVVNDHQFAIAREFEKLGHVLVAYKESHLRDIIHGLSSFEPKPRKSQPEKVAARIASFIKMI